MDRKLNGRTVAGKFQYCPIGKKSSVAFRRLVVTKQPSSEFYKDEGGRSNYLSAEVSLLEFNSDNDRIQTSDSEFVQIPLKVSLHFESGKCVDDSDQDIFKFVGNDYDSIVIKPSNRSATIDFRLEKVSRRKDGQRFKLKIEPDLEQCTSNVSDIGHAFTNAICVLSKRKYTASNTDAFLYKSAFRNQRINNQDLREAEDRIVGQFKEEINKMEKRLLRYLDEKFRQAHIKKRKEMAATIGYSPLSPDDLSSLVEFDNTHHHPVKRTEPDVLMNFGMPSTNPISPPSYDNLS